MYKNNNINLKHSSQGLFDIRVLRWKEEGKWLLYNDLGTANSTSDVPVPVRVIIAAVDGRSKNTALPLYFRIFTGTRTRLHQNFWMFPHQVSVFQHVVLRCCAWFMHWKSLPTSAANRPVFSDKRAGWQQLSYCVSRSRLAKTCVEARGEKCRSETPPL